MFQFEVVVEQAREFVEGHEEGEASLEQEEDGYLEEGDGERQERMKREA